jgi:solute carrier family 36 (proton-coupled amino acid transporter)
MGSSKPLPKASYVRALSYMVKSYVGSGAMSMPLAFEHSGFAVGVAILVMLLGIVTWNLRSLELCKQHYSNMGVQGYADLTFVTVGVVGKTVVDGMVNLNQFLVCAIYFDFVAENLSAILPAGEGSAVRFCILYIFPVFACLSQLPSVESIAQFTSVANACIFFVIGVIITYACADLSRHGIGEDVVLGRSTEWPLFFATAVYSFEGVTNFFPVENALKDPSQIFSVLYVSMMIVGTTYCCIGGLSYLAWPSVTKGSITAQLSEDHPGSFLWTLCAVIASIAVS